MRSAEDIAFEKISEHLAEVKEYCQAICLGLDEVKREIDEKRNERRISGERISAKLDAMMGKMTNVAMLLKHMDAPAILAGYKVCHPEYIDTTPQDMYDEITTAAQEIEADVNKRCEAFGKKMKELTADRDSTQYLSDCVALLKSLHKEMASRRDRIDALKNRRQKADKGSNEQRNAAILIVKVRSMLEPLEKFTEFVLDSYFAKRRRIMAEIWRTTSAIEQMYDDKSREYKEIIPSVGDRHKISSALRELTEISHRHAETSRANILVKTGDMSALERRKVLAGLKHKSTTDRLNT